MLKTLYEKLLENIFLRNFRSNLENENMDNYWRNIIFDTNLILMRVQTFQRHEWN